MHVISVSNVNSALRHGLEHLKNHGSVEHSRNGRVLVAPTPVATVYGHPTQRVLFSPLRDANPFFHYVESMWMIAGFNDVKTPAQFARQMEYYTDDGSTLNGAYGYRWRRFFGYDQLGEIVRILQRDPTSRRCVLAMWSGSHDLRDQTSKDLPCNTHIYFRVVDGCLDMTVCCRSNDIVWGAYGANSVHMSMLQEYMALRIGVSVGTYTQLSFNYHLYLGRQDVDRLYNHATGVVSYETEDRYFTEVHMVPAKPLFMRGNEDEHSIFFEEVSHLILNGPGRAMRQSYVNDSVRNVLWPLMAAHEFYRIGDVDSAIIETESIDAVDWRTACREWLQRRKAARMAAEVAK